MSAVTALCRRKPMGPSSGKAAVTPSAISGSGRGSGSGAASGIGRLRAPEGEETVAVS